MGKQQHQSNPTILDRRTLQKDHRYLARILTPGMSVLDVGCGTGAITVGIAEAVGPNGFVVGVDRDASLIARAQTRDPMPPNLRFECAEAADLGFVRLFDIVTAARTLQWIADVGLAISRMGRAVKPGGLIVVLDYNQSANQWEPDPPVPFVAFYRAFLEWRRSSGWDNEMANRLPGLFAQRDWIDIETHGQDETSEVGDDDFFVTTGLWSDVILNVGPAMQKGGFCDSALLEEARNTYDEWRVHALRRQTLSMSTVVARLPFELPEREGDRSGEHSC